MSRQDGKHTRVFYGWWIVAAGSLVAGMGSVNMMGFTVFFLPLSQELGLSRAATSLVPSIARLEGGLLGPLYGAFIDRFGARRAILFGSTLAGAGLILLGTVVHSFWSLIVVYVLVIGIGFNTGFFPAVLATINAWFIRKRTLAMSMVNAAWGAAAFILVPTLSFITIQHSWRAAAVFAGCLVLLTAIPASFIMRRSPEAMGLLPDGRQPSGARARPPAGGATAAGAFGDDGDYTVREALRTRAFWMLVGATNLRMLAYPAVLVHFAPLLVWKGLSLQAAANTIGVWSLILIPMSIGVGFVADKLNKRFLLAAGALAGCSAYLLLALGHGIWPVYLFIVLLAVMDCMGVTNWSLLGDYFGRRRFATLRGIVAGTGSIGVAVAPVYAGFVFDRTESYQWALLPFAGTLALSGTLYALMPRSKARREARLPQSGLVT